MSFDWKGLVGTVAPTIASVFGTPLVGVGVKALCVALGLNPSGSTEIDQTALEAKLAGATPQDLLAIKNAEQQFIKDMKGLDIELAKLELQDVDSARKMQTATKSWGPAILAAVAILTVIVLAYYVIVTPSINEYAKGVVLLILGRFLGYIDQVFQFDFGTTRSSRIKDDTIQKLSSGG